MDSSEKKVDYSQDINGLLKGSKMEAMWDLLHWELNIINPEAYYVDMERVKGWIVEDSKLDLNFWTRAEFKLYSFISWYNGVTRLSNSINKIYLSCHCAAHEES